MLASFLKRDLKNLIQRDASPNFQVQNGLLSIRSWWRSVRSLFLLPLQQPLVHGSLEWASGCGAYLQREFGAAGFVRRRLRRTGTPGFPLAYSRNMFSRSIRSPAACCRSGSRPPYPPGPASSPGPSISRGACGPQISGAARRAGGFVGRARSSSCLSQDTWGGTLPRRPFRRRDPPPHGGYPDARGQERAPRLGFSGHGSLPFRNRPEMLSRSFRNHGPGYGKVS